MNLNLYIKRHQPALKNSIEKYLPVSDTVTELNDAIRYAVFSGGKRIRPVLTLLGAELFGSVPEEFFAAAAASEFIHASSLIFDDLPCMDDASERRGKTSLHKEFGEGIAILAAVSLLNASYGLIFESCKNFPERKSEALLEIVECIGTNGMTGGQAVDLMLAKNGKPESYSEEYIEKLKNLKTSALFRLSLCLGAILAGAGEIKLNALRKFSVILGEAYQTGDDLIDLFEDAKIFAEENKPILSADCEEMQNRLRDLTEEAKNILHENFAPSSARNLLIELSDYIALRKE